MTLRHIKIFVAVCETGSITAAGEKLFLAQPAVSLAIADLENYYGIKLFDRIARRLYITEAGRHLFQYATHIVRLFEDMEKEVKNIDNIGVIRVGASITIGNYLLPRYITALKERFPSMHVKVVVHNSDTIQQFISENKIDIGFIEGNVHDAYITAIPFRKDELSMIAATSHPFAGRTDIAIAELEEQAFLLREAGSAGREIFDSIMAAHGLVIEPLWESISTQAIIKAVQANLGISVLPYLLIKDSLDRKEISCFSIKNISFSREFSVVYHKNKFLTQSAQYLIEICQADSAL